MAEDNFHLGIKALIRDKQGRILLLQEDPAIVGRSDYWDMPGGRVDRGQSIEETLRREVAEEARISNIKIGKQLGMVLAPLRINIGDSDVGLILSVYECEIPEDTIIQPSDSLVAYEWVMPAETAARIANKYPSDFCAIIARLGH